MLKYYKIKKGHKMLNALKKFKNRFSMRALLFPVLAMPSFLFAEDEISGFKIVGQMLINDIASPIISVLLGMAGCWKIWEGMKEGFNQIEYADVLFGVLLVGAAVQYVDLMSMLFGLETTTNTTTTNGN
jgi:hypothetical protein